MEINHKLGLYVSYYLSRFDNQAYQNLGFGNQLETHLKIGELLSIKPQTVKNWRDEFDPLFGHRAGWYQRPMIPSRVRVAQALENLDETSIRSIVNDILSGKIKEESESEEQLLSIVSDTLENKESQKFILRAPTGKAAEEFFVKYFSETQIPYNGELFDCRDLGVGYDFRIENGGEKYYVEVKGLADNSGEVLFTNKEWAVALNEGERYILCIVTNVNANPAITLIKNPGAKINPKKNIFTSIQINWSITESQLKSFK